MPRVGWKYFLQTPVWFNPMLTTETRELLYFRHEYLEAKNNLSRKTDGNQSTSDLVVWFNFVTSQYRGFVTCNTKCQTFDMMQQGSPQIKENMCPSHHVLLSEKCWKRARITTVKMCEYLTSYVFNLFWRALYQNCMV